MESNKKRWFDDWLLSFGSDGRGMFVRVELPRHPKQPVTHVYGNMDDMKSLANLLDKLLCELTGAKTRESIEGNGRNPSAHN